MVLIQSSKGHVKHRWNEENRRLVIFPLKSTEKRAKTLISNIDHEKICKTIIMKNGLFKFKLEKHVKPVISEIWFWIKD